jgi:membrane protein
MVQNIITSIKKVLELLRETFSEWLKERPLDQCAIVSFYSIFALPGLLMITITIAGSALGEQAVEGKVEKEISEVIGNDAGKKIQILIAKAYEEGGSILSTVSGIIILLFATTGVFVALQRSLNKIYNVQPDPGKYGIKKMLINRILSFGMILSIGFLLLISLAISGLLSILTGYIDNNLSKQLMYLYYAMDYIISYGLISLIFTLVYKFLPDAKIPWKSVWIGALVAAFLFLLGRSLLSIYFNKIEPGSPYGVASFFVLLILWIAYSCLALTFGAKLLVCYTIKYIGEIKPNEYAIKEKNC